MKKLASIIAATFAFGAGSASADGIVTLIQTGDFHGHLIPRPNLRNNADYPGQTVGGLARVATKIKEIQAGKGGAGNTLVLHTGDTIQGSGEALYTRGKAIVDVVDMLGLDGFAPGNWDWVYGLERFEEFFGNGGKTLPEQAQGEPHNKNFGNRWGALAANVYYTDTAAPKDPTSIGTDFDSNISPAEYENYASYYLKNGKRVLPPYTVRTVNGVKIGIMGCTTSRGPQVVGRTVTAGLEFTDCSKEIQEFTKMMRTKEQVDVVVLISEIEIGRNIQNIKLLGENQHIDVILNSDMHEESLKPIQIKDAANRPTWIVEAGQDGTLMNEIQLSVQAGQVSGMTHTAHRVDDRIKEDEAVARKVAEVRAPFNEAFDASIPCDANSPYLNSFTRETCLNGPLSEVLGSTEVALQRNNYSHEKMPAVIEGSSHDFVADAIRWWARSDLATVRGFRYGTHVAGTPDQPGAITRNDLFHFVPIGPRVGKASRITLNQLRNQVDNSTLAIFSTDPGNPQTPRPNYNNTTYAPGGALENTSPGAGLPVKGLGGNSLGWGGGWMFAYSAEGFSMNFAPFFKPSWHTVYPGSPVSNSPSGVYLDSNSQVTRPAGDTSRARSMTVYIPCRFLPPVEQVAVGGPTGCATVDEKARFKTVMTTANDGKYTPAWVTNYGTGINNVLGAKAQDTYLLNPDGWQFLYGTPNNPNPNPVTQGKPVRAPFQAPAFTVAGYWYKQSPNTINNCNNCYPTGSSTVVGDKNAAYLLPVNMNEAGEPSLDGDDNPIYERDPVTNAIVWRDGKPSVAGKAIDLTEIVEKYIKHFSGSRVTTNDLPLNRIGLVNNEGTQSISLPDFTPVLGFPLMQPLCGLIDKTAASALDCLK